MRAAQAGVARRDRMILLLAIAGGGVDAVVLLVFGVLTAAQTGNTVILAISLARGQLTTGLLSTVSVVGYVSGAAVAELIILGRRDQQRAPASGPAPVDRALVAELVPLGCLFVYWHLAGPQPVGGAIVLLVALAAVAMGMQSAVVLRLHAGPTTTYVTGTLTQFTTEAIHWLRLVETTPRRPKPSSVRAPPAIDPWVYGITWITYLLGALVSALLYLRIGELALVLPIAAIAAALAEARGPTEWGHDQAGA